MSDDIVLLVLAAGVLWPWSTNCGRAPWTPARRRIASPRETCSRAVVQFLDGTVAFAGFRLRARLPRPAPAAAHLHLRLHQRRLRAVAGLHRAVGRRLEAVGLGGEPFLTRTARTSTCTRIRIAPTARCTPAELVRARPPPASRCWRSPITTPSPGSRRPRRSAAACGVRLVPGVEISAAWRAQAIHVLGLWIDPACRACCRRALPTRPNGAAPGCAGSAGGSSELGLPGDALLAAVEAQPGLPTRTHLAAALLAGRPRRVAPTKRSAAIWAAARRRTWPRDWPALAEVVGWIRECGRHRVAGTSGALRVCRPARGGGCSRISRPPAAPRSRWSPAANARAACRRLRGARGEVRPDGLDRLGLPQSATSLGIRSAGWLSYRIASLPVWRGHGL